MSKNGFTLVELMVTLVVLGVMLAFGLPTFSTWTQNAQIRTSALAIQSGLNLARSEAIRRNTQIRFQLTSSVTDTCAISTSGNNWVVSVDEATNLCGHATVNDAFPLSDTNSNPAPRIIQTKAGAEGGGRVSVVTEQPVAIFNGLGRLSPIPPATAPVAVEINVYPTGGVSACTNARCLRINVSIGGQIRMCDPNLASGDIQRC